MPLARRPAPVLLALLLAACSGGGPSEPRDTTPPGVPAAHLVAASVPQGGVSTVTGSAGAVEPAATVVARNGATGATAEAAASAEGAFSLQIPATIGDPLTVTARDAAGNESAPLALSAGPAAATILLAIEDGDGQVAVTGHALVQPLGVRVTVAGAGLAGIPVRFEDETGDGALSATQVATDASGVARVDYTLGAAEGTKTIRARILDGAVGHSAAFALEAVGPPVVESVTPAEVAPGATVTIAGRNYSPVPGHTGVRIGGREATVLAVTRTEIQAVVPYGISGDAAVEVILSGVSSAPASVRVLGVSFVVPPVGQVAFAAYPSSEGVAYLPFESGSEAYVLAFESASRIHVSFTLRLDATVQVAALGDRGLAPAAAAGPDLDAEALAEGYRLLARHGPAPRAARALAPAVEREFHVLNVSDSRYELRAARLEYEGPRALVYVDAEVPAGDFPTDEARLLGQAFEVSVYDAIRAVYGSESDLDANGKTILLLTPLVNDRSSDTGRVLGFFNPGDLADHAQSNRGELFYLLVPDPGGLWGTATPPAAEIRELLVSVAAHEFVHMINANERHLLRRLLAQAYWLEEGLAHHGEKVVGRLVWSNILAYLRLGAPAVSLVGQELLTRGASTLFVTRQVERFGLGVIRRIVTDPGISTIGVESATSRPWEELFHDWALAMHNELYPVPGIPETFTSLDVRGVFSSEYDSPEEGNALGRFSAPLAGLVPGPTFIGMHEGSVAYLVVDGGSPGELGVVRFSAPPVVDLQVAIFRVE